MISGISYLLTKQGNCRAHLKYKVFSRFKDSQLQFQLPGWLVKHNHLVIVITSFVVVVANILNISELSNISTELKAEIFDNRRTKQTAYRAKIQ